jgi:D-beta-D-heptose 7-phosphate kinase/D-beta-D-heptose 1-phosphate adenosyltransferase
MDNAEFNRSQLAPEKRVVFTNGCFDLLHVGHLRYLQDARSLGDFLIVGLNSDASVRRLKGAQRPVQTELDRAEILLGLRPVDAVVIFGEDTPLELIKSVKPDVLVKGGDWKEDQIVGADVVKARGGEVRSLPFHQGRSTTSLIEKILSST